MRDTGARAFVWIMVLSMGLGVIFPPALVVVVVMAVIAVAAGN